MEKENYYQKLLRQDDSRLQENPAALQIALHGKPRAISVIPLRTYFNFIFGTDIIQESIINTKNEIKAIEFVNALVQDNWEILVKNHSRIVEEETHKMVDVTLVKDSQSMVYVTIQYKFPDGTETKKDKSDDYPFYSAVDLGDIDYTETISLFTGPAADKEATLLSLTEIAKKYIRPKHTGSEIGIVSISEGEYYVKNFSLESKTPEFTHPDLHYGQGFNEFHGKMLKRLETTTKGLVLLHGEPGTGKTQYIRVLLKELSLINKSILYAPPSLSASLTDPAMIEFISDWVLGEERDCILLIEDAEPLLEVRGGADGRTIGISNLLNMTDGLLNDILGLTVIATFNTPLAKIDPALLRPQRLVARKEFRKLGKDQFIKLSELLGIELPNIVYPATLAEFYAAKNSTEVLVHDVMPDVRIGFNR